jgi:nitrate reductase NapAB chaperone NapD
MMTSGLVVMLEPESPESAAALEAIRGTPTFILGDQNGCWLSVALEADNGAESEHWHDWLRRLPGVASVEVVFVHSDDVEVTHVGA